MGTIQGWGDQDTATDLTANEAGNRSHSSDARPDRNSTIRKQALSREASFTNRLLVAMERARFRNRHVSPPPSQRVLPVLHPMRLGRPVTRLKAVFKAECQSSPAGCIHTIQPGGMAGFRLTDEEPASGD